MDYRVNLEKFSGPLYLLLSLIEEKKLAINDISLSKVTDQFLDYLKSFESGAEATIEYRRVLADFLIVASRLILIKSCSLLPNLVLSAEEEGDIKDLEKRLRIYQQIKLLGRELGKWAKERPPYFSRGYFLNFSTVFYPPKDIVAASIKSTYELFLKTLPQVEKIKEKNLKKIMTIEEKIKELTARINAAAEASFASISGDIISKIDVILTFLALLMLFRSRILTMDQNELFGDIKIKSLS